MKTRSQYSVKYLFISIIAVYLIQIECRKLPRRGSYNIKKSSSNELNENCAEKEGKQIKTADTHNYEKYNPILDPKIKKFNSDNFVILKKLGSGKFSNVLEAIMLNEDSESAEKDQLINIQSTSSSSGGEEELSETSDEIINDCSNNHLVAIKCLKTPTSLKKIQREVFVLNYAKNLPNIVTLRGIICFNTTLSSETPPALVLDHAGLNSTWFCHTSQERLTLLEIKYFLYQLLIALEALHSHDIMHRDIKPRNILITKYPTKQLVLCDLGLSDFYSPSACLNVRVASRHYKAPELLLGYEYYSFPIDMWAVGCILASLLCDYVDGIPFFRSSFVATANEDRNVQNLHQLYKIMSILGTNDLTVFLNKIQRQDFFDFSELSLFPKERQALSQNKIDKEGLDLISHLLVYDPSERLTAKKAMQHAFFNDVRDEIEFEWKNKREMMKQQRRKV